MVLLLSFFFVVTLRFYFLKSNECHDFYSCRHAGTSAVVVVVVVAVVVVVVAAVATGVLVLLLLLMP